MGRTWSRRRRDTSSGYSGGYGSVQKSKGDFPSESKKLSFARQALAVLRALCQAALTGKDRERGGGFDGILNMILLRDDNVDLIVIGVELTKGEGPEGNHESNRGTYFSHVRPCTLPVIGELICMMFRDILVWARAKSGRCKTRAKRSRSTGAFAQRSLQE